jgi:hypothetical protein
MSFQPIATAYISWLSLEEGGREKPPSGNIYAATAKFAEQGNEFFSVALRRSSLVAFSNRTRLLENRRRRMTDSKIKHQYPYLAKIREGAIASISCRMFGDNRLFYDLDFFAPKLVMDKLSPGTKLWITEGPRTVAQGEIVSVDAALINKIRSERKSRV